MFQELLTFFFIKDKIDRCFLLAITSLCSLLINPCSSGLKLRIRTLTNSAWILCMGNAPVVAQKGCKGKSCALPPLPLCSTSHRRAWSLCWQYWEIMLISEDGCCVCGQSDTTVGRERGGELPFLNFRWRRNVYFLCPVSHPEHGRGKQPLVPRGCLCGVGVRPSGCFCQLPLVQLGATIFLWGNFSSASRVGADGSAGPAHGLLRDELSARCTELLPEPGRSQFSSMLWGDGSGSLTCYWQRI